MKLHFIAIGGSAMHNLAIALQLKGYQVSGSDDEIFEPSKGRLKKYGLLPESIGWHPERITNKLDAVILGMHAKEDNPELLAAKNLGVKIYSYPEYLYEQSKNKKRIVIGGSHGKTTITSMILHVLNYYNRDYDYMVGAQLEGFEVMVKLSENAPLMVFEGDEYLTSPIDRRPKFHLYKPDIAVISGIAWDHINVFPTFPNYVEQFEIFASQISSNGSLIYCEVDDEVKKVGEKARKDIRKFPYDIPTHEIRNGKTFVLFDRQEYPIQVFGEHNLMNLNGARLVCEEIGINGTRFFKAIASFSGASKRLELIKENENTSLYKDFAHSPSKLEATTRAVKEQYVDRELVACIELHTYSSLSEKFLGHYKGCMDSADIPVVYFNPHAIQLKKLPPITKEQVRLAFDNKDIRVYTESKKLLSDLLQMNWQKKNLLMMSSGDFDGIDFIELGKEIVK
jgi:UDP-N-acetylmuramate: L-alanyl-gamma-D-glutamyl-meso-diaminopimelate ligase